MRRRTLLFASSGALALMLLLTIVFTTAVSAQTTTKSQTRATNHHDKDCLTTTPSSDWSPIGGVWHLTVTFLKGSRQGQSEISDMTFLPTGKLTATFPGPTPSSPPTLPPAVDGHWCMVSPNVFEYGFKDQILVNGQLVAYVQTHIYANLTSASTYEAGGVGVGYAAATK